MNIVLLSNHWYFSARRAGFHHLADAYHRAGHSVTFVTTGLSYISYARRDYRTRYAGLQAAHNVFQDIAPRFRSYVFFTLWHPHTLLVPWLDACTAWLMDKYALMMPKDLRTVIAQADAIIYESSSSLFLLQTAKELAPTAKHIYRVSDDIRILRSAHPRMITLEQEIAPHFDLVSVPCTAIFNKFPYKNNVCLQFHGINKKSFDECGHSVYKKDTVNCIFVGNSHLDTTALIHMALGLPSIYFHIIGKFTPCGPKNIVWYGEMPYLQTIPYIMYADVGLQIRMYAAGAETLTDSLKVLQYRYCGLPIVAPKFLDLRRDGVFYYDADPHSCVESVQHALAYGKNPVFAAQVHTWDELAMTMLEHS